MGNTKDEKKDKHAQKENKPKKSENSYISKCDIENDLEQIDMRERYQSF